MNPGGLVENVWKAIRNFLDKQRAIEEGFELAKQIARDTVFKTYPNKKSIVEVEIRALRPMLMKE